MYEETQAQRLNNFTCHDKSVMEPEYKMQAKVLTSSPGGSITNQIELWSGSRHSQHSHVKDYFLRTLAIVPFSKPERLCPTEYQREVSLSQQSFQFFLIYYPKLFSLLTSQFLSMRKIDRKIKLWIPDQKKNCLGISLKSYFDWSILASTKAHYANNTYFLGL